MGPFGLFVNKQECIKGTPDHCTHFWKNENNLQALEFLADSSDLSKSQKGLYCPGISSSDALELIEETSLQILKQELYRRA